MIEISESISLLKLLVDEARNVVAFTGAGISTESGIPDFRSPNGIWSRYRPIEFADFLSSEEMRRESWRRKMAIDRELSGVEPNRGHRALSHWVQSGKILKIITQNIDGLHQRSGVPARDVIELHGNGTYARCLECDSRYELDEIFEAFDIDERLPVCTACGGIIKSATISFGQAMPEMEMLRAEESTLACDLFLAIGSSLVVYPAAGFPVLARRKGAKLVIINREPTSLDCLADLVINAEIGPVLGGAARVD